MGEVQAIAMATEAASKSLAEIAKTKTGETLADATKHATIKFADVTGDIALDASKEGISGVKTIYKDKEDVRKFAKETPEEIARGIAKVPVAVVEEVGKLPGVVIDSTKNTLGKIFGSAEEAVMDINDYIEGRGQTSLGLYVIYCIFVVIFLATIFILTEQSEFLSVNLALGGIGVIIIGLVMWSGSK